MNRILLVLLICGIGFSACKKTNDSLVQYKAQAAIDDKIIADYLTANPGLNAKRIDTSGVFYIVKTGEEGSGNDLYTSSTQVTLSYTGRLLTTGAVFSETESNPVHPSYSLGSMIRGWQLGIPQIKKGGKIRLLIPSRYAYGPYPQAQIGLPANAVLDFSMQLYNVTN
ncbi:FKBP-type peptidyl-prolyl cis-trans isomerase FkpA [Mucilaginibacter pineti]|uniref:Peptidyl-prolyl cis-trans isomerase n=1 Tax=Mucilaginibacter pineti TaxID=1391627 RepID=A0A1G7CV35_9SPHI|nr:FKBP-type peptidyl-prolyl cis-trans isomerase [Mucilaginibacter pineti]SDE42620.1 FKBP-type peptidyl-prolyl cis-trans isomerase FkpA [Mucilaginibacter pineti]